jgi:hypothetical protein
MEIFQPKAVRNVKHCNNESDVNCSDVTRRGSAGFVRCLNWQYVTQTCAGVGLFGSRQRAWNLEQASTINLTVFFFFARKLSERMWMLSQKRFANENVQKTGEYWSISRSWFCEQMKIWKWNSLNLTQRLVGKMDYKKTLTAIGRLLDGMKYPM